jgi:hypothetical protein
MFLHAAAFYIYQSNFTSINFIFSAIIHFLMEIDSCITIHEAEMDFFFLCQAEEGVGSQNCSCNVDI